MSERQKEEDAARTVRSGSSGDVDADEFRSRLGWWPTPEQFAAYLEREVEMAKINIKKFGNETSLHSFGTMMQAQKEIADGADDLAASSLRNNKAP